MAKTADTSADLHPWAKRAWAWLVMFWSVLLVGLAIGGTVLTVLGPPHETMQTAHEGAASPPPPAAEHSNHAKHAAAEAAPSGSMLPHPPDTPHATPPPAAPLNAGAIAPPDAALLEAAPEIQGGFLPRIAADGRTSMRVYAARFDTPERRPRVAILVAGLGMNLAESEAALTRLPAAVSFAVTPYATRLDPLLDHLRAAGHEILLSLPLEPAGYPLNDPGTHALLTGAPMAANAQQLQWAMTRFNGFVGVTGAMGDLRGERFAASFGQLGPMLDALTERGLFFLDARANARLVGGVRPSQAITRSVDLVLDDPPGQAEIDAALAELEKRAVTRGAAIGLVGRPSPLAIERLSVWAVALNDHGVALAPVSSVVQMPLAP